jgi:O-antigen/teichoic acid export membrane protein
MSPPPDDGPAPPDSLRARITTLLGRGPIDTATREGRSRERYRRLGLTFVATLTGRGVAAVASLIAVPVMLRYVGAERYGLWAALSSTWTGLLFADLGISNGLLSVLAEDTARGDREAARRHVSSAFAAVTLVALALAAVFALSYPHVSWAALLGARGADAGREAGPMVAAFIACFLLSLPLGLVARVRLARQEGFSNSAWAAAGSFVGLGLLMLGIHGGHGLPVLALGLSAGPVLALLAQTVALFGVRERWLCPRFRLADRQAALRILGLGFAFSVLQLAGAVAAAGDALVAGLVLGPVAAARFAVVVALFDMPLSVLIMLLTPLWPAYGDALARHDVRWVKKALRRSLLVAGAFGLGVGGALVLLGRPIVRVWVGPEVVPGLALLALMAVRLLVLSLGQAVAVFLNGVRLIRLQLAFAPFMALSAVALKVWGAERWGLPGLVAGGVAAQLLLGLLPYALALRRWPGAVREAAAPVA